MDLEIIAMDRHLLGDVAFAVLLALPAAALARPAPVQSSKLDTAAPTQQAASTNVAHRSLLG
jgi:hypothetical protein